MRELSVNELRNVDGGMRKVGEVVVQDKTISEVYTDGTNYYIETCSGSTEIMSKAEYEDTYAWMVE
ncbi:MAG: hypothetical protein FXF47_08660 [Candidatus Mcinerneyibacterium aminivorans]|uniref:Bacteriocin n=1 Tax=Candidatus Mcinerneyibacterium aminivorans TaxID=2703815 RepID=A0A5D0MH29_9BACT|nr:MAG: hypothetical protein FXF47_08660 [Candidatus Mcinerneyibacterium aminivorans]